MSQEALLPPGLLYFHAAAREGSFHAAARICMVSQPTVSKAIQALEADLGVDLFDRVKQRVYLTTAGRLLASTTVDLLARTEAFRSELTQIAGGAPRGNVRLAALRTMGVAFVPELVAALAEAYPDVTLSVAFAPPLAIAELLRDGQADLGLLPAPAAPDLEARMLGHDQAVLVSKAGDGFPDDIAPADLASLPLILTTRSNSWWTEHVAPYCARSGVQPKARLEVDQGEAIMALLERGLGASILPGHQVWGAIQAGRLKRIRIRGGLFHQDLLLVNLAGRKLSRAAAAVAERAMLCLPDCLMR
ncbi:MAG: LysR family transcriptional regulator [Cyanobacteria bacterium REEB65]|nr:LysR family transcriptional regulator [Cyanobacteria bacterium REEB65]